MATIDERTRVLHDPATVVLPTSPIPVFPLRGLYLFPHLVLPLHIFEPRYRQLVGDLLDGPGRMVIARPAVGERETKSHSPELAPVAGIGELLRHERLPDGRFHIWLLGLARVHIREAPSDRLYRQVTCTPFAELAAHEHDDAELATKLRAALATRVGKAVDLPDTVPTGLLVDVLLQTLGPSPRVLEHAYTEPSIARRASYVLRIAARGRKQNDDDLA